MNLTLLERKVAIMHKSINEGDSQGQLLKTITRRNYVQRHKKGVVLFQPCPYYQGCKYGKLH